MSNQITIQAAQNQVDQWIKTIGVNYFSELTNLGVLMEEVGELSRLMVRKYGDQSFKITRDFLELLQQKGYEFVTMNQLNKVLV